MTSPGPRPGLPASERDHLRVALLVYRGNPRSGGQGVYTRFLSRELARQGHQVTVFAGQPWPHLDFDAGVSLVKVPSLDLYREPDPFRMPRPRELRTWEDVAEVAIMLTAGFPEPRTFSYRAWRHLTGRRADFDIIHDNQSFGPGLVKLIDEGWPMVGTCHHPVTVDRLVDMGQAQTAWRRASVRRWYGFVRMQNAVARRFPRLLTVSSTSRRDIVEQMGVAAERVAVVPVGADHELFRPLPDVARVPGRVMTTASADVPLKGLSYLLEALAKLRTEMPEAHLVVVGEPRPGSAAAGVVERLGLEGAVTFRPGVSDDELVRMYAEASAVAVPSLYEGFSLPAVEAMACQVPVVTTTGGALPEVVGRDGDAALLVPPGDAGALAAALTRLLGPSSEPQPGALGPPTGEAGPGVGQLSELGLRLGVAGRQRVLSRYTWAICASGAVDQYRAVLADGERREAGPHPDPRPGPGPGQPC